MSATEIMAELPKLSPRERRRILDRILELEDSDKRSPKLVVIVGLPGSGKSFELRHRRMFCSGISVEDFMADSIGHSRNFAYSRHYRALIESLREGHECVIADIEFCRPERRKEFEDVVCRVVENLELEWVYFENDLQGCTRNIQRRNRSRWIDEISKAKELSATYVIPDGSNKLCVFGSPEIAEVGP